MHALPHILNMAAIEEQEEEQQQQASKDTVATVDSESAKQAALEEMEAQAVDKAKATADSSFRPSNSVMNATTAAPLLAAVDGPSLATYEGKESVYVGRMVPVSAGGKLELPIHVGTPGSVVEYAVEVAYYDVDLAIQADREDGITIVKVRMIKILPILLLFYVTQYAYLVWLLLTCTVAFCIRIHDWTRTQYVGDGSFYCRGVSPNTKVLGGCRSVCDSIFVFQRIQLVP